MLADYHFVRRHKLKLDHLYCGDKTSIYWFHHGFNWRAFAVFILCSWPFIRTVHLYRSANRNTLTNPLAGLIAKVNAYNETHYQAWVRLYNLTFIVGVAWSFALFAVLNITAPAQGLHEDTPFITDSPTTSSKDAEALEIEMAKPNANNGSVV